LPHEADPPPSPPLGENGNELYFVSRGSLQVVAGDGTVLATITEGSFFGERAVLENTKRGQDVIALTNVELFVLKKEDLYRIINEFPELDIEARMKEALNERDRQNRAKAAKAAAVAARRGSVQMARPLQRRGALAPEKGGFF
jgi:CRP-like cAMP-binding protein